MAVEGLIVISVIVVLDVVLIVFCKRLKSLNALFRKSTSSREKGT